MDSLNRFIHAAADQEGFSACAVLSIDPIPTASSERFERWISAGCAADMAYLYRNTQKRADPSLLVPGVRTLITTLTSYNTPTPPHPTNLARYARFADYHRTIKDRLHRLAQRISVEVPLGAYRCFVDSAPVMERTWALQGGLGWIGRNSMLINPQWGSYTFLGEIVCEAALPIDQVVPIEDHCRGCRRCIEACPTQAITSDRGVDARRCLSYHTIENAGEIPTEIADCMHESLFGCDICQSVCPWNVHARLTHDPDFQPRSQQSYLDSAFSASMTSEMFEKAFADTALIYSGFEKVRRNAEIFFQKKSKKP